MFTRVYAQAHGSEPHGSEPKVIEAASAGPKPMVTATGSATGRRHEVSQERSQSILAKIAAAGLVLAALIRKRHH